MPFLFWHVTHGVLGQGRDRQAGVDPRVGRDDGAAYNIEVGIIEHLAVHANDVFIFLIDNIVRTNNGRGFNIPCESIYF